jgi:hypothetical protein
MDGLHPFFSYGFEIYPSQVPRADHTPTRCHVKRKTKPISSSAMDRAIQIRLTALQIGQLLVQSRAGFRFGRAEARH